MCQKRAYFFILLCGLLISFNALGQSYSLGVKGGVSMSCAGFGDRDQKDTFATPPVFAYTGGFMIGFPLKHDFQFLAEAGLSFIGLGIQPPGVAWGLMVAQGREVLNVAWWVVFFPGLAIMLTVLSLCLVAVWLRTIVDPLHRREMLISKH